MHVLIAILKFKISQVNELQTLVTSIAHDLDYFTDTRFDKIQTVLF